MEESSKETITDNSCSCEVNNEELTKKRKSRGIYNKIPLEKKQLLIRLFLDGETIKYSADKAGMNLNTAKTVLRAYKANDEELVSRPRGGNRPLKLTSDVLKEIEACIDCKPDITLHEIKMALMAKGVHISKSTIDNGLRKIGFRMRNRVIPITSIGIKEEIDDDEDSFELQQGRVTPEDMFAIARHFLIARSASRSDAEAAENLSSSSREDLSAT